MSIVVKTRRGKTRTWSTSALWVLFALAVIFFLVIYGQQLLLENNLNQSIELQRVENAKVADDNTRLKSSLFYYQSDRYIEQRAREDLNLRRPDEEVLIPIQVKGEAAPVVPETQEAQAAPPATQENRPKQEQANWAAWLDLFRPSSTSP